MATKKGDVKSNPVKAASTLRNEKARIGFSRTDMYKVPFSLLRIMDGFNVREDYGDIQSLAANIQATQQDTPIRANKKDGLFYVTHGHRRYSAFKLIAEQTGTDPQVYVLPEEKGRTKTDWIISMFGDSNTKELTVLEQAEAVKRLMDEGNLNEKQIAEKTGRSQAYINRLREFEKAPPELVDMIKKGLISSTAAINMLVKKEVPLFVEEVRQGLYDKEIQEALEPKSSSAGPELFAEEDNGKSKKAATAKSSAPKQAVITEKLIKQKRNQKAASTEPKALNSWAELKTFVKGYEGKPADKNAANILVFVSKVINNEITPTYLKKFFKS